jgi:hypothetical protein
MNYNMERQKVIYALVTKDGRIGYIGSTRVNAKTRWWEHRARARSGHNAPVYDWMREEGIDKIDYLIIQELNDEDDISVIEAAHIKRLIDDGHPLANQIGRDGKPNSNNDRMKKMLSEQRKGKPTWIKGKRGVEAGWTEERKKRQAVRLRESLQKQ